MSSVQAAPLPVAAQRRVEPALRAGRGVAADVSIAAVLHLATLSAEKRRDFEARGVRFRLDASGQPRHLGSLYTVDGPRAVLQELAQSGLRVSVDAKHAEPELDVTGREIQAIDVWGRGPTPTDSPRGAGITVLHVDIELDVLHPHLFEADGGAVPWVDLDGDGTFTAGVDGVDTNLDGEIEDRERLMLLDFGWRDRAQVNHELDGLFDPSVDYLYVDFNSSGQREAGPFASFTDASPGFGEPVFLPDDADGDGALGPEERVILLKTSKIKAVRLGDRVYRRGEDLITTPLGSVPQYDGGHGTAAAGIVVGGQDRPHRRYRGLVPDAELVAFIRDINDDSAAGYVDGVLWGADEGAQVAFNIISSVRDTPLDGSNVADLAFDALAEQGVVSACAAGNMAIAGRHTQVMTAGGAFTSAVVVPPGQGVSDIAINLHWREPSAALTCTLTSPSGSTHSVEEIPDGDFEGRNVDAWRLDSDRGTAMMSIRVTGAVSPGQWSVSCTHDGSNEFLVHGMVTDEFSTNARVVHFQDEVQASTLKPPSTSDSCFAVAAYAGHFAQEGDQVGELRSTSSRGPRIDGAMGPGLAAPNDPISPAPLAWGENMYRQFGGTSGATPHVAAAMALLRSAEPELTPAQVIERLQGGAIVDEQVEAPSLPDPGWGFGKLRVYQALYGEPPPPRPEFRSRDLVVEWIAGDGVCTADVSVDRLDWPGARVRWDTDYDGEWDTEYLEGASTQIVLDDPGAPDIVVRAALADGGWVVGGKALVASAPPQCFEGPVGTGTTTTAGSTDETGTGSGANDDGGSGGCGCSHRGRGVPLFAVVVALAVRRRRSRIAAK